MKKIDVYFKKSSKILNQAQRFAEDETRKILIELGADAQGDNSLFNTSTYKDIKGSHQSFSSFLKQLDIATYDLRSRTSWNARMGYGFLKQKVEKEIQKRQAQA